MKKGKTRTILWFTTILALILIDEYVKEGYIFDIKDVAVFPSHENIFLMVLTIFIAILMYINKKGEK